MSKKAAPRKVPTRTPHDLLAQEASDWDARRRSPAGFEDATDALPRAQEAEAISLRMPKALLKVLKAFAERERIGYQVLIKRWLDDRIREERNRLREEHSRSTTKKRVRTPQFPIVDRDDEHGHYQSL